MEGRSYVTTKHVHTRPANGLGNNWSFQVGLCYGSVWMGGNGFRGQTGWVAKQIRLGWLGMG